MRIAMLALAALAALAGCSEQPTVANDGAPTAAETPPPAAQAPVSTPVAPAAAPRLATLPPGLLGAWTADPQGRCAPGTELRIVVAPSEITFYESRARITSITQVDPHSWGIDAEVAGEGDTWTKSFDLSLNEDGTMTRVEAPVPDVTYTRCKDAGR